jgi:hypothetical protein
MNDRCAPGPAIRQGSLRFDRFRGPWGSARLLPDIDQAVADKLIVLEVRKALDELEHKLPG